MKTVTERTITSVIGLAVAALWMLAVAKLYGCNQF
jgi:hypothetical protein